MSSKGERIFSASIQSGSPMTRSSSKAGANSSSKAAEVAKTVSSKAGPKNSGVSKDVIPASKGKLKIASSAPLAGGGVLSSGSKANVVVSAKGPNKGSTRAQIEPRQLNSELGDAAIVVNNDDASEVPAIPSFLDFTDEQLFDDIVANVKKFDQFREAWTVSGQLSPSVIIHAYNPETFVAELRDDVSGLDRASAHQAAVFIMKKFVSDTNVDYSLRVTWAEALSGLIHQAVNVPAQEVHEVHHVDVSDVDDADQRQSPKLDNDQSEFSQFAQALRARVLNASTVFGSAAGFVIVPHEQILEALRSQAAQALASSDRGRVAPITWPRLTRWDSKSWLEFERKWWNAVNQSVEQGQYMKMMSCIDINLFNDIQCDLKISADDWFKFPEIDFLRRAHGHFGPLNKEQAKDALSQHICFDNSRKYNPEEFLHQLSVFNTKFLRTIDLEIAPSIGKWPLVGEAKYGPIRLKTIRKAFRDGFAKYKHVSVACDHCYDICEQNPQLNHAELYGELRSHFQLDVDALRRNTLKQAITPDLRSNGGSAYDKQSRGGSAQDSQRVFKRDREVFPRDKRSSRDDTRKTKSDFPIVAGKDRCWCCGDYNNHYGAGCSAETCFIFGTKYGKKKGHVWKDSVAEPKVSLPKDEWLALRKSKPKVVELNTANRIAYIERASKFKHYSSLSVAIDLVESSCPSPQLSVVQNPLAVPLKFQMRCVSHEGNDVDLLPPLQVIVDFTPMEDTCKTPIIGERFFGMASFDELVSPSVVDVRPRPTLYFSREVVTGPQRRDPMMMKSCVSASAHFNAISPLALSQLSKFGKLKRLDTDSTERPEPLAAKDCNAALLSFKVQLLNAKLSAELCEWFLLDSSLPRDLVILNSNFMNQYDMDSAILSAAPLPIQPAPSCTNRSVERVFFDSGAQMSCMSPHIAIKYAIKNRQDVDVEIIQMGNVVARCYEAVELKFLLYDAKLRAREHSEWFLLWNNPYGIILGSEFCKQFTTWHRHVAPFTQDNVLSVQGIEPSAKRVLLNPWRSDDSDSDSPGSISIRKRRFRSIHPVTSRPLKYRDAGHRPQLAEPSNHVNHCRKRAFPGIFTEAARREPYELACRHKEKRLLSLIDRMPASQRVAFDVAELQMESMRDRLVTVEAIMRDAIGLPVGLMMGCGASGVIRRSHLFSTRTDASQRVSATSCIIPGHDAPSSFLVRKAHQCNADGSDWNWSAFDEAEYLRLSSGVDTIDDVAASDANNLSNGAIVKFVNCIRQPDYNGMLARLYSKLDDGRWQLRMMGKNQGHFVTARSTHFVLHDQQRPFVSSVDANFNSVGIDDGGMPVEDIEAAPRPVHRQFGKEYSASLTLRIKELLSKYQKLFDNDISEPCDFEEMDIVLKPNAILPGKARYYKNTPAMRDEVRRQVEEQLAMGIIEKSHSPVVSNVLLVKRPHMPGRYRFVVDYQKINDATVPDQLMMPDIKSQHDRLANKCIFGAVDITSYYRLIKLKKDCRYLTAFATDDGVYVYNRVAMGLRNACSHAQRALQEKLADDPILGVRGANIRNYFDDIAWGSNTEDEFMQVLEALMEFGLKHKLKYNLDKSCFGVDSITHVGFIANKDGIRIDPERTRDIVELQPPKSTKKVQSILGVLNFVRNFIPQFSIKAKFLTDRLDKAAIKRDAKNFVWSESDEESFRELKALVLTAPLLSIIDYSSPIHIRCDSSRFGCGAVLFQFDKHGRELPVCYASRKYTPAETRYSTFQQEMGAVVWSLERFQEYTQGYKVIVETDHRNIAYVKRSAMPQLARWRMRLEAFDFDIHYRSGPQQEVADGLSRSAVDEAGVDDVAIHYSDVLPEKSLAFASPSASLHLVHVDAADFREQSVPYDEGQSPLRVLWNNSTDRVAVDPLSAEDVSSASEEDSSSDSGSDSDANHAADVVPLVQGDTREPLDWSNPAALKTELERAHNDMVGHGGVLVTLQRMLRRVVPNVSRKQMLQSIDAFLTGCPGCQKMRKRSTHSAVRRRVIHGNPFEELSVDILCLPFPDALGNNYVVTIVDNFSHWVSVYACQRKSAVCASRALMQHIGIFGAPLRIRSDGGGEFVNDIVVQLRRLMDCEHLVVHPYLHSANGIAERANRAILDKLRFMLFDRRLKNKNKLQWSDLLPFAQRIVNASFHSAIGASPSQLIFGGNLDLDRCILSRPAVRPARSIASYVDELSDAQFILFEAAEQHQQFVQDKVVAKTQRANAGKPDKVFEAGDLLLLLPLKDAAKGTLGKLAPKMKGPLTVESVDGDFLWVSDPVKHSRLRVLARQCELWDDSIAAGIEGAKKVAETDGFEFAIDSIIGHGLENREHPQAVVQLPQSHRRVLHKRNYWFAVTWTGYLQPSWVPFKVASALPGFAEYVARYPLLRM
jgi:hypothetical protein